MTRRVGDAAALLSVMAGEDPNDPTSLVGPAEDYSKNLNKGMKGVRIGFDESYASRDVSSHVVSAMNQALREMEKLGALIVPVKLPATDELTSAWGIIMAVEALAAHDRTYPSRRSEYGEYFRNLLDKAVKVPAPAYAKAMQVRANFNGQLRSAFQRFDVLACPTTADEAPLYDPQKAYEPDTPQTIGGVPATWLRGGFTMPYDLRGYPALSLPSGQSPEGMPLSLQLVGKPLSEALLLQVGHAYEVATTWHLRHPPV